MDWILEHMSASRRDINLKVKLDLGALRADAKRRTRLLNMGVAAGIYIKQQK
jgi:hypothetical protein